MTHKILTVAEKYDLLAILESEIEKITDGSMKDVFSIMMALLYENIILEHEKAVSLHKKDAYFARNVIAEVRDLNVLFEALELPSIVTPQYVSDFTDMADRLAILSKAVTRLKELLTQAASSGDTIVVRLSN